ncbi:MAG: DNA polymerase I [Ruminococcus sp.]|nr:DNA polymerase I [Ruminococcus sp.]
MKLLAIDGNSILNRAYYGIRPLSNTQGIYTHAIFGFMNIYLKQIAMTQPDAVAVAFDLRTPTFRHKAVKSYKANRKGMPEELAMQMPYLKKLLGYLGISVVTYERYEADDILGTLAKLCTEQNETCVILTGDRDSLQLVNDHVTVALATNRETIFYTPELFQEEYGFAPLSLIDYKALMGDSSDNISGVIGIGQKTASQLIGAWDTIENLYAHLDEAVLRKTVYQKLTAGKADAEQSKWLATIVTDVPIDSDLSHYTIGAGDSEAAIALLRELEMAKLLEKLFGKNTTKTALQTIPPAQTLSLQTIPLIAEVLTQKTEQPCCLYDGETLRVYWEDTPETIYTTNDKTLLLQVFQRKRLTFQAKSQYCFLFAHGITPESEHPTAQDAEIAAYLLNSTSTSYEIQKLCITYHIPYAEQEHGDLMVLPKLYQKMHTLVEQEEMLPLLHMEEQLTMVLASMESVGVAVDRDGVETFGIYLSKQLEEMQQMIYDEAGHEFNIASPKQLGDVLFEEMQLPHGKKTKKGYSTNADILEKLRGEYPIVDHVLQWRQYAKLKSTYVDGLLKTIAPDGRIHTIFRQTETRTGRISSTEPNLQNIPARTSLGRNMRKFFVAKEGNVLLDADYSQIELRLLANLSGDKQMRDAFLSGTDIHAATAAQVFEMPQEMVTHEMRSAAKAVNFGILYGMGAYSLSQDIHVTVRQANQYIQNYMAQFPSVGTFMDKTVADAKRNGFVTTYFKRRRPVSELTATNKMVQASGKRIAMNTPIQGTAADIIKIAMIRVYERLKRDVPEANLVLQVHDELIVEVPEALAMQAAKVLGEEMQGVIQSTLPESQWSEFPVPLSADVAMGTSWFKAKQ